METSKEGHRLREYGHATVVQYDLTSSEDELGEDHSYVYCSAAKLSPMRPQSSDEEQGQSAIYLSSSHDSEGSGEEQVEYTTVPPPLLIDLSSSDGQSSDEEQELGRSKRPRLVDVALTPTSLEITDPAATPAEEIITISSCSEGEDKAKSTTPSRKPYAMRMVDLPPELQRFLNDARSFFTRAHSLERHGQQVAVSTYMKAEERILCKYFTFIVTSGIARISFFLFLFFCLCGFKLRSVHVRVTRVRQRL